MFCSKCGKEYKDGDQFCDYCGANLPEPQHMQPSTQPYTSFPQTEQPGKGAATASLVCGIIGIFVANLILGIIAIVQGNKAKKLGYNGGMATVGIVLGIIDIVVWVICVLFIVLIGISYAALL